MIKVVFFAALRDKLGCDAITVEQLSSIKTVADVKQHLCDSHPQWQTTFSQHSILCAVNHTMSDDDFIVKAGDEVAFFPPVTGG